MFAENEKLPINVETEENVWDDSKKTVEVAASTEVDNTHQIANPLEAILKRNVQIKGSTQVLRPSPYHQQNGRPVPWIPLAVIGGAFGSVTLFGIVAMIISALPNAQLTRQQEISSALAMEITKQKPTNNVCFFAVHCPESGTEQVQAESVSNSDQTEANLTDSNKAATSIVLYENPGSLYENWYNYYARQDSQIIANDANRFDDVYCSRNPERCQAMNDIKNKKIQLGEMQ